MSTISIKNLANAIYESSLNKEGISLDEVIENSAKLIKDKNLLNKSEQILSSLEKIIDKKEGIIRVKVSSRTKITDKESKEIIEFIKKRFEAKEVILEIKEDISLLGGIKIETGDEIIDTTLRNKLNQLQNYLITN